VLNQHVTWPDGQQIALPATTVAAINQSSAKYAKPLWHFRAEKVLKLGAHQWIFPADPAAAQNICSLHTAGIRCMAWKLFNRGWAGAAEAYFLDQATYPEHPRHLGRGVIPLVDEDEKHFDNAQIGWVRIEQSTVADQQFAIFVQFTLLDLFPPRALAPVYQ